ncbi:MAG: hypothetical protein ACETWQ_22680 [Phycisphaerae bacterium]
MKQKYTISNQKKQEIGNFDRIKLDFRQAKIFDQWWQAVCIAADELDFARGLLPLTNRDGTERKLVWEKGSNDIGAEEIVKMTVPIHDRRADSALNMEVQVHANGSLESASRRLTLFSRLLEKHSVANLTG